MMLELVMQTTTWMMERMIIDHAYVFLLMLLTYAFSFKLFKLYAFTLILEQFNCFWYLYFRARFEVLKTFLSLL